MILRLFLMMLASLIAGPTVAGDLRVQGRLISEATSVPPLVVSSTDVVSNLNADKLDGFDIGDFGVQGSGVGVHYKNLVGVPGEEIDQDCAVNTGCFAGDSPGFPVTITEPGSYRLAGNLEVTSSVNGITVEADHVTLDLAGFVIDGTGTGQDGIQILGRRNVEVRNGTVRNFAFVGVRGAGNGTRGHRMINIRAEANGEYGIFLNAADAGFRVSHCVASGNGAALTRAGIFVTGGTVIHNVADSNSGNGIHLSLTFFEFGGVVAYNTASQNGKHGIEANRSTVFGNTVNFNAESGIVCLNGMVRENTSIGNNTKDSTNNGGIRIAANGNCQVLQNNLQDNQQANINARTVSGGGGDGSVIVENRLFGSARGLWLQGSGNFYNNNWAANNTTDYDIAAGNTDGGSNISY